MTESLTRFSPQGELPSAKAAMCFAGSGETLLEELVQSSIVLAEDVDNLAPERRAALAACQKKEDLLAALVELELLTDYQAGRIEAGTLFALVLGNYRILDRLGAGGMGVVFRAEHIKMRKQVAIKTLPTHPDQDPRILRRFMTEVRAIAQLQHPNIVGAIDAGEALDVHGNVLHFFVMEYVPGQDLEEYVRARGPMAPSQACDLMHQVASALAEANKHHLVHRDIKPSNIQVTPEGQAKLLDFGLARKFSRMVRSGLTEQGTLLGTIDYMAPEQVQDAHKVDIRADLYGLGGVLYWCLTGSPPFPASGNLMEELTTRLLQKPPPLRARRPELSLELEQVVQKLMALNPEDRYSNPEVVMRALLPFLKPEMPLAIAECNLRMEKDPSSVHDLQVTISGAPRTYRILLVDDEPAIRLYCKCLLQAEGMICDEADGGREALHLVRGGAGATRDGGHGTAAKKLAALTPHYDLLVLDLEMGDMPGTEVCRQLRENGRAHGAGHNLKIIMASGVANTDTMAQMLLHGADDFITKPFSGPQLQSRVKSLLRLKDVQDRAELLKHQLLTVNHELEQSLSARNSDLVEARNALVLALAKLVRQRANETGSYLVRLQKYVRVLGEEAGRCPAFAEQIDENFVELAACCAPLHDIGKVGLPDHILLKPGKLDTDERLSMQAHTAIGAETLQEVATNHPSATAFLQMAIDIARHHHERFDGGGYPDRLAGEDIPLAARMVAICDVYDALRSRRLYRPALSHHAALEVMSDAAGSQFDPALLGAFKQCASQFEKIYRENPD